MQKRKFDGPLRVSAINPRYFTDNSGKAIFMAGSHTWENFQRFFFPENINNEFSYEEYINLMHDKNHNFMRMWMWEQAAWMPGWMAGAAGESFVIEPMPYKRTGTALALDGKPKFDLDCFDEGFFELLRKYIIAAGELGIYVSIMLFQGFSIKKPWLDGDPWNGHPYNIGNNINGVGCDKDSNNVARIHELFNPEITRRQEQFTQKVIDTVNDLDNIMYEIINEGVGSDEFLDWEYHMTDFIHEYEKKKPKQHPVGITASGNNKEYYKLFECPAEWMSPNYLMDKKYKLDPPAADGRRIILNDTDHAESQNTVYRDWVWKCLTRGHHAVFMDPWNAYDFEGIPVKTPESLARLEDVRNNLGYAVSYSEKMNLASMTPQNELSSSTYCLASRGCEYLVFIPQKGEVEIDLTDTDGSFNAEWFNPADASVMRGDKIRGGKKITLVTPFENDAVLYLSRA